MKGHCLNKVSHTKYLWCSLTRGLRWSMHTNYITSKPDQSQAFFQRNLISCPAQVKINCYKTVVSPIMDYCSTVWCSCTICSINKVKAIQRRAARFVLNDYSGYSTVTTWLNILFWHSVKIRIFSLKLIMFYKIINRVGVVAFKK